MIHPDSEIAPVRADIGLGVRATRRIPRGTLAWALDRFDIVLSPKEVPLLGPLHLEVLQHYGYRDHAGRWILCWDAGRLVNHSCSPAMRGVGPDAMIAVRDLEVGDELTCDYAECNVDPPLDCLCGAPECRRRVAGADLLTHHPTWDAEVRRAASLASGVDQPLWPILLDPEGMREIFKGRRDVPSLKTVYLSPELRSRLDCAARVESQ